MHEHGTTYKVWEGDSPTWQSRCVGYAITGCERHLRRAGVRPRPRLVPLQRRGFVSIEENGLELEAEWRLEARSVSLVMSVSSMPIR